MSAIQSPVGSGGGGGGGTVTSVAGGTGITNSPEPIVGAGTVNLDIDSLTTEALLAAGDLFAFVDVSAGGSAIANQRKITFDDFAAQVVASGLEDYLFLPGRTGTTNDPIISLDADGTIYGSASPTNSLLLASSTAVTTPQVRIAPGGALGDTLIVGDPAVAGVSSLAVTQDVDVSGLGASVGLITLNGGMAASSTIFGIGANGSFSGGLITSGASDNLFKIIGVGCDANNNFVFGPEASSIVSAVDGTPGSGFVPGQMILLTTDRSGESHNRLWIRHDGDIGIGNNVGYPEGKMHVRGVVFDEVVTAIQGATKAVDQTANLTNWLGRISGMTVSGGVSAGSTSITLVDSTGFPSTGVIYLENGDQSIGSDLPVEYSANNTGTGELTLVLPLPNNIPGSILVYMTTYLTSVDAAGMVSRYMGILTAERGIPAIHDSVPLTAQTTTVADTSLTNTDAAGVYRVSVYAVTTTGDLGAGSITVEIKYTDDGIAQTVQVGPVLLTTTGAFAEQTIFVQTASGDITYGVTNAGGFGTADYSLYVVAERLG